MSAVYAFSTKKCFFCLSLSVDLIFQAYGECRWDPFNPYPWPVAQSCTCMVFGHETEAQT